jgi:hypothetical protein
VRQLESALARGSFQQQVADWQEALVVSKISNPFIKRIQVTGITQRKRRQQLKVAEIARRFQLNKLFKPSVWPYTLVMLCGVVVNEGFFEFPKRRIEFCATFSAY